MRKVIATGIAWLAIFALAISSVLTRLAEAIYRPRRDAPPGDGA